MASDSLNQIGKYLKRANNNASLALKRDFRKLPKRERARDSVSSIYPFTMVINREDEFGTVSLTINFNKPPPDECTAECIATTCEQFELLRGGHSVLVSNPYESGTVKVYVGGLELSSIYWYEENPSAGQVYVQAQGQKDLVVICYTYIVC